jgi:regulator of sirC expression with transglutaminase-like and TPR domain
VASLGDDLLRALDAPGDDIAPAALLLPRLERPRVDPEPYLRRLDELGRRAGMHLEGIESTRERVIALSALLFHTLAFAGKDVMFVDPRTHFISDVLDRRRGIPIALSTVYIEVGRRAGLPLEGVSFPGHFLVRCRDGETGELLVIDAFNRGVLLSERECLALLREQAGAEARWSAALLAAADRRQILTRMLGNLKRAYVALRAFPQARRVSDLLLALDPSNLTERRDRGLLSYHLEDFSAALRDLERYLQSIPHASEADASKSSASDEEDQDEARQEFQQIWEHVKSLRRRVAAFN